MTSPANQRWLRMAVLVALVYPVVGISFAAFGNPSISQEARVAWRLAAWLVSAAAFLFHLWYEHSRLGNSPLRAASHVSAAVALGAFGLAIWVIVYGHWIASGGQSPLAPWALVLFPAVTGVPAFVVAFVLSSLFARMRPRPQPSDVQS
jgi:hypothetical protein